MQSFIRLCPPAIAIAIALFATPAFAQQTAPATVAIVVNGTTVNFDQPPIERAGRVFVPLRGVFERLGATVVYANGLINAQGHGRSISLNIGSTQATINGSATTLDQAPFMVGARTLVPLRFVAQALGAVVNYNGNNQTVYINSGNGGSQNAGAPPMVIPARPALQLENRVPLGFSNERRPRIGANFSSPVRRNSINVSIDGNDFTQAAYFSGDGLSFYVTPNQPLSGGRHVVRVTGTTRRGVAFDLHWTFTTQPRYP